MAISRNRRARVRKAAGSHTAEDIGLILKKQKYLCVYCLSDLNKVQKHVDHIIPISQGGSNYSENLQVLCQPCNNKKHAKHPIDYAQSIGLLL